MKVFRDINNIGIIRPVATIGIFDGVHLAHQAIIKKLTETAHALHGESTIVTLWPHPRMVLSKDKDSLKLLNTLDEKIIRLEKSGVDNLVVLPFDKDFAGTGFDQFIRNILVEKLGIAHLVVGFNHQFGKDRKGNFDELLVLSNALNFGLSQQEPVMVDEDKVSSSAIRSLIESGEIRRANHFLGYRYKISGKVVEGNQKGREIGFPTANLTVNESYKMIPKDGVYAVQVLVRNTWHRGMMNIGCRPTIAGKCFESILEVNLFDFEADLYGQELRIEFVQRVRSEKKFESFSALKKQLILDQEEINNILSQETF